MITPATTPLHPDDRLAAWTHKRSAYVNNEPAARQFCLRPVTRINLATPDGQPHRERGTNESQSGGRFLFFCKVALAACGLVAWLALAWILPALLDVVMR